MSNDRTKDDEYIEAALHIRRTCPHDIGGQMVLAAFAKESIDRRHAEKEKMKSGEPPQPERIER